MMVNKSSLLQDKPREFLVNDTFCIFLKEKNKELPYFASKISDITKVQQKIKKKQLKKIC